ncbi:MAG TPA: hypothetical protein VKE41_04760 [Roseiflexaceae bacterium]|nr:hypothetical protein [Roseiflexaceae bacterium]
MVSNPFFVTMRTLAERGSRNELLKRRLPARFGGDTLFVSPGALLKLCWPLLESADPALFAWATEFVMPGDVVWDTGANAAFNTLALPPRAK